MPVAAVLPARSSSGTPPARRPLPARKRRRLPLGRSLRRLQLTLQLPDAFLHCPFSASRRAIFASALFNAWRHSELDLGCDMECDVSKNLNAAGHGDRRSHAAHPTLPLPPRARAARASLQALNEYAGKMGHLCWIG